MVYFRDFVAGFIGVVLTVVVFLMTVGIGAAVNKVTFSQQMADWFGPQTTIEEPTDDTTDDSTTDGTTDDTADDKTNGAA